MAGLRASAAVADGFAADLLAALARRPRSVSPKYFYDERGSQLFDAICELPEYYPTRTELGILRRHAPAMAQRMGSRAELIEFGAGSLRKVRHLLDALIDPLRFVPIDISGEHLAHGAQQLRRAYPGLDVRPLVADFTQAGVWPAWLREAPARAGRRIGFFPGSSLGNFAPDEALRLLRRAARLLRGGALILGVDLIKSPQLLHAAYNDAQGVTAAFNRNLLVRANRELGADFDPNAFAHSAFYNAPQQRIEMHLLSRCRQSVHLLGQRFEFAEGETLHTEHSYKFTVDGVQDLARAAGFVPGPAWCDDAGLFCVQWLDAPALMQVVDAEAAP